MEKHKLLLKVDEELWEKFKLYTPRTIKLNDMVVSLIREYVSKCERGELPDPRLLEKWSK